MTQNFDEEELEELEDNMEDDAYWYERYRSMKEDEAVERYFEEKYKEQDDDRL